MFRSRSISSSDHKYPKFKIGNFDSLFFKISNAPSREHCRDSHCYLILGGTSGSHTLNPSPTTSDTLDCGITSHLSQVCWAIIIEPTGHPSNPVLRIRILLKADPDLTFKNADPEPTLKKGRSGSELKIRIRIPLEINFVPYPKGCGFCDKMANTK